ncbi:hypothetical protein [Rhodococcoides corynebacterioides]|uniref:Secreted protein n=1 Tax=Rhodococcoides corynebacterioides TaxID=53972 RepID=A0ABS7P3H9_9NOCA|nr:hypothetical protein [Rhodococcus corynebacterioides]MBY6366938.1 hypothetical protein [Rhodococcus corynebacterioides]MBY6407740.1 hypothetical protein [Rhodococcus corynebacterioides]
MSLFALKRAVGTVLATLAMVAAGLTVIAPAASAGPVHNGGVIEYYQYCYDRTPAQQMTSPRGASPKHYYKTAVDRKNGVDCKYLYAAGNIKPTEKTIYHSYSQVCKNIGFKSGKWYRTPTGLAACR